MLTSAFKKVRFGGQTLPIGTRNTDILFVHIYHIYYCSTVRSRKRKPIIHVFFSENCNDLF